MFEMTTRKDRKGYSVLWSPAKALPRVNSLTFNIKVEIAHVDFLADNDKVLGITANVDGGSCGASSQSSGEIQNV
jgi:hypothetical protein